MKTKILLVLALALGGWWLFHLHDQNERLEKAQLTATGISPAIRVGNLRGAGEAIKSVGTLAGALKVKFAALPYIREGGEAISRSLPQWEEAWRRRSTLTASTARKVVELARAGRFDEAQQAVDAGRGESGADDENLKALGQFVSRIQAQDFKSAEVAAKEVEGLMSRNLLAADASPESIEAFGLVVEKERKENYGRHEQIASEVKSLISLSSSRESSGFNPLLKGKAMIWDETKGEIETAYQLLPDNLRASSRDGTVTIFSIMRREQIQVGRYSVSGQPGYKEKMLIGVVYWPEKRSAGTAVVWGTDPAHRRPVTHAPGYGSSVNIKDWIAKLPSEDGSAKK